MSNNTPRLYNFSILLKKILFNPNTCTTQDQMSVSTQFYKHREEIIFQPLVRPITNILNLNTGKSFTFGLSRDNELSLSKKFIIDVNLQQINPYQMLSKVQIDVTKKFREVFTDPCSHNSTVYFYFIIRYSFF